MPRIASVLEEAEGEAPVRLERLPVFEREHRFRAAFVETIKVLEETRKSFKSRQLEALRRRLTQVLLDAE